MIKEDELKRLRPYKQEPNNFTPRTTKIEQEFDLPSAGTIEMAGVPSGKMYVDNKVVLQNNLQMHDLERMFDSPDKFYLSNYLKNKVIKKR